MGITIIHGIKDNGLIDAEFKCTAVLVTELINNLHKMSEWEVYKALVEIREAAERDARTAHTYAAALKAKKEVDDNGRTTNHDKHTERRARRLNKTPLGKCFSKVERQASLKR